jgi:hypothetical protein
VLANFGGLMGTLMLFFRLVGERINKQLLLSKKLESLYLVDHNELTALKDTKKRRSKKKTFEYVSDFEQQN